MGGTKYGHFSGPGANERIGNVGCKYSSDTGMVINDEIASMCWAVTGLRVNINGTKMALQEGFEVINFNLSQSESQPAVPTNLNLPGRTA